MEHRKLVEQLAGKLGRSKADVNKLVEALAVVVKTRCSEQDSVVIPSFGTFEPHKHTEQVQRDPETGQRVLMPPTLVVDFTVSNVLKNKLKLKEQG